MEELSPKATARDQLQHIPDSALIHTSNPAEKHLV